MTLHIPDFPSAHVLVAGDVMPDQYWFGATQRSSPKAPASVGHDSRDEERPVNGVDDRLLVLCGLAAVDRLAAFADDKPRALIEAVLPDVLVEGGDAVICNGGEGRASAFRPGRSSSSIIAKTRGE